MVLVRKMLSTRLTLLLFIPIITASSSEWSYNNTKQWVRKNRYCAGNVQSPIDLQFNISRYDRRLKQLSLDEQQSQEPIELVNNGHTAQLSLAKHYVVKNVAPESEDYNVEQAHFHWGHSNDNTNGSEHLHEGQSYPLELHIVSYSSLYSNIRDAMSNTRGLAVIGVFFEVAAEANPSIQPLVDALKHVRGQGTRTPVGDKFNLKELIDDARLRRYYRYDGSLTTPPCFESVVWNVLIDPLKISLEQLHAFRYLHDDKAKIIKNTYRPVKPLGTRILFRSFHSKDVEEDAQQRKSLAAYNSGRNLNKNIALMIISFSLLKIIF